MSCGCGVTWVDPTCPTGGLHGDPDIILETLLIAASDVHLSGTPRAARLLALYAEIRNWPSGQRQELADAVARRMREA